MLGEETKPKEEKKQENTGSPEEMSRQAAVKGWCDKIRKARDQRFKDDFDRMRQNMDFTAGLQWPGQKSIMYNRTVVNMTLQAINQRVAQLYAKDPQVAAKRRKRLCFTMWDGKMETIQQAMMLATMSQQFGLPLPPDIPALIQDFQQGRLHELQVEKVGETLKTVLQYQMDTLQPGFKTQMKQLVRRVCVCGVGYIKVLFCRDYESELTQSETRMSIVDRAKMARAITEKLEKQEIREDDPEVETLRSLVAGLGVQPLDSESTKVQERLVFDFPQATAIIPDPQCRALKGFVGAHWVAEEYHYPLEFVNAFFEKDIKPGGTLKLYNDGHTEADVQPGIDDLKKKNVRLWEVSNLDDKSTFMVCDGYNNYITAPEVVSPGCKGFWNIVPVTFNDIETEPGCRATIFPPSDVDLIFSTQVEWNNKRWRKSRHCKANGPRYMYPDGAMSEQDIDRITGSDDQEFIKVKGVVPGADVSKIVVPLGVTDIKPELYDTQDQREDLLLATGQQEANIGPAQPNVTATVGTIAAQSHMNVASSNVDGLDDSLSLVMSIGGELCLKEMSVATVKKVAGPGSVWPEQNREDFINEIETEVVAASSGRPNKAIDVANWERVAPILVQAGANPQAIVRQTIKVLDANIEPEDFFPVQPPPQMMQQPQQQPQQQQGQQKKLKPKQPLQPNQSGGAVPLAAS